jgi:hypothetical protein
MTGGELLFILAVGLAGLWATGAVVTVLVAAIVQVFSPIEYTREFQNNFFAQ